MNLLRTLPVKIKLPLIIVGLCLVTGIVLQVVNDRQFRVESRNVLEEQIDGIAKSRGTAIENALHSVEVDLQILAGSPEVASALGALGSSYRLLPEATGILQKAYIDSNPNPGGKRQNLDMAEGPEAYHRQHAAFHPMFRKIQELRGLYDLFLFDADMNNIYTVFKEADFAASFKAGPLAESGLGVALHAAAQAEAGTVIFSDFAPYAPSNGVYAGFVVTRIASPAGMTQGYVAFQLNSNDLAAILDDRVGLGATGSTYLVGGSDALGGGNRFVIGTDVPNRVAEDVAGTIGTMDSGKITPQVAALTGSQDHSFFDDVPLANGQNGFALSEIINVKGAKWNLIVEREAADVYSLADALLMKMILIGLGIATAATAVGVYFARSVTKPLDRISLAVDSIANGDLQVKVVDAERGDELGVIANSLNGLLDKLTVAKLAEEERERLQAELRHVVDSLSQGLQNLSEGNLTQPLDANFAADYDSLRLDFNATRQTLASTIAQVVEASQTIKARSAEISTASEDLSRRTEKQAAALEETAAALDELTASVKSAADGAREVENIVRTARKGAEDSGVVVQGAVAAMAEIEKSSEQISQIIGAIDDIAFQTNLLALNAGVEAARAGDAGKGFAVVASEVRALAQRSSAAAKEIKTLIAASAKHVGRGVDQVGKAGEALVSIVGSVANISTLMSNMAAGAAEQSTGLAEINIGVTQLDQVTQQNAAMVEQSTAASHALNQDAAGLAELVSKFRIPPGAGNLHRDIPLSQFVPTDFAGPQTFDEEPMTPQAVRPAKSANMSANASATTIWQDF